MQGKQKIDCFFQCVNQSMEVRFFQINLISSGFQITFATVMTTLSGTLPIWAFKKVGFLIGKNEFLRKPKIKVPASEKNKVKWGEKAISWLFEAHIGHTVQKRDQWITKL